MSSAGLVHRNGFGSAFRVLVYALIALSSSAVDRCAPRLIGCSDRSAKKRSTWLIQDEDVGVKWTCQRRRLANQARMSLVLWLDALTITTCMSNMDGTFRSTSSRNLRNSRARWR